MRQLLAVKENLDFNQTKVIDLGTKTFSFYDDKWFYIQINDIQTTSGTSNKSLILSSLYKTEAPSYSGSSGGEDMTIRQCLDSNGTSISILIRNNSYAYSAEGATQLRAAMKGVLLAYKKASN